MSVTVVYYLELVGRAARKVVMGVSGDDGLQNKEERQKERDVNHICLNSH